ncbi:PREDICTED: uncharacterized protein LOC109220919, partial [Nicotiana attenuata]|uniref:uncharacterized protein LOC109220919 n=1 Tax=Nicotiana attenuata TaxID=49451 RepID=UPI000904CEFF
MAEIQDFNKCVQDLGLSELAWEGEYYMWSNKQAGSDRIWSRIDRLFGNYEWMMQWGHVATIYDVPFISDHAPMSLSLTRLHSKSMQNIWMKLKTLRSVLRKLNVEEFKFIRKKIEKARIDLARVQRSITTNCSDKLLLEEKGLIQNLEKWDLLEEGALKQKARARWIKLGDSNTKYFTTVMKERNKRKQILELTSIARNRLNDSEAIKEEIL